MNLSVVIPTRWRDESLARCLTALRPQVAAGESEVIVSDDGRSDSTRRLVEERFAFARWTSGPQRGPAANRNHGASLAGGDFIVFLDDDVEPTPGLLDGYRRAMASKVNLYEGRTTCRQGLHSPLEDAPANETGGYLWSCNMMIRRTLWQRVGGFDEDFPYPHMEDVAFRERLVSLGERAVFVPDATVDHAPRPVPGPSVLARQHESHFVYSYKYLGVKPSPLEFAGLFLRHRLGIILAHPPGRDSLVALGSMCVEAFHVARYWRSWDEKWRGYRKA